MLKLSFLSCLILLISINCLGQNKDYDVDIKPKENALIKKKDSVLKLKEAIGHCKFVPLYAFNPGMKFYFPHNEYKEKDDYGNLYYSRINNGKKKSDNPERLSYKDLAGRQFIITKIDTREGIIFPDTYVILKEAEGVLEIESKMQVRIEQLKQHYNENPGDNLFNLNYAIYTPDIDSFKNSYLNKYVFTNFKVNGRKYQKVKIINVGAGSEDAPIRIVFETPAGIKDQKDVCTCGTNVPTTLGDLYKFLDLFSIEDPRNQYRGPDSIWDLICEERVRIGMTEQELLFSWGKPKKVNQTIVEGKSTKQFIYSKGYVYVDNGVVTGLQNN
jgi:hypothetical protein